MKDGRRAEAADATLEALERWTQDGLGFATDASGARRFDAVVVVNHLRWSGVVGGDRYWLDHSVPTSRRLVSGGNLPAGGPAVNLAPAEFRMQLRRDFDLGARAVGDKLRLRAPTPLARPSLRDLKVHSVLEGAEPAEIVARNEYLEARCLVPESHAITLGADLAFVVTPDEVEDPQLSPEQTQLYLRKTEWPIGVTPRVETLAAELAADRGTPLEAVSAFWDFINDTLMYGMIHYSDAPAAGLPDWVLDHGWYDCQAGSALLISLCRAHGIPARMVSGHFLYPLAPTHHYWTEVWIEDRGWLPFDFFSWDLSNGGQDPAWRNVFAGQIDHRAVSQCFPTAFTGPMSVRLPAMWQMVVTGTETGIEIAYYDADTASTDLSGTRERRAALTAEAWG